MSQSPYTPAHLNAVSELANESRDLFKYHEFADRPWDSSEWVYFEEAVRDWLLGGDLEFRNTEEFDAFIAKMTDAGVTLNEIMLYLRASDHFGLEHEVTDEDLSDNDRAFLAAW